MVEDLNRLQAVIGSKAFALVAVLVCLFCGGCAKEDPVKASEEELVQRYKDVVLTPEGVASIIDDRNKREGRNDRTDYAQAFADNVTDGMTQLRVLEALDHGDVAKAKQVLITAINIDTGFLPVFRARAGISEAQRAEAEKFARNYLDYLIAHTNEVQVGGGDFAGCFAALGSLLEGSPDDQARLTNLVHSLGWLQLGESPAASGPASNKSR
jgi:hypothetical protein